MARFRERKAFQLNEGSFLPTVSSFYQCHIVIGTGDIFIHPTVVAGYLLLLQVSHVSVTFF